MGMTVRDRQLRVLERCEAASRKQMEATMARYYETPDVDREREPSIQGVCKDCGNGTLNNELNPAFSFDDADFPFCSRCGSTHLDLIQF